MKALPVDLWTIPLTTPCPTHLSETETTRANRFHFEEDRVRWIRARSSLRRILSGYMGSQPDAICFTYGEHGKPALLPVADLEFNLSHAGDWAMVAVARSIPVGVDIERIRSNVEIAALLHRLGETDLPETLPSLFQAWTQREARTKAAGGALFHPPAAETFAIDVTAPDGYAASIALVGHEPQVRYCGSR
jgi:4'-phosphopantetheinyl transferase